VGLHWVIFDEENEHFGKLKNQISRQSGLEYEIKSVNIDVKLKFNIDIPDVIKYSLYCNEKN
jgi:hypothetical protein